MRGARGRAAPGERPPGGSCSPKDGEASVLENDVLHTRETVARLEREMETARKSDEDTAAEIKEKQEAYSRNEKETKRTEAEQQQLQKKLDELRSGMDEQSGRIADLNRQVSDCSARSTELRVEISKASSTAEELRSRRRRHRPPGGKNAAARGMGKRAGKSGTRGKRDNGRAESLRNAVRGHELRLQGPPQKSGGGAGKV